MAIALTGADSLFVRWGHEIGGSNETCVALQTTLGTRTDTIFADYDSADQEQVDGLYSARDSARGSMGGWLTYLQTLMQNTVIDMAFDDGTGINPKDLVTALDKLIAQMVGASDSINRPVISATVTANALNVGNGTFLVSLVDPLTGDPTDMVFAETLTAVCTDDNYAGGGATEGQEPWTITGEIAVPETDVSWPQGSGASTSITTNDPSDTGNVITDGDFEDWTVNTPNQWEIAVGTAGTTILKGTSPYVGSYDLEFVGNGSELTCVRQTLTLTDFEPGKSYGFAIRMKTDGSVAAGVARLRLVDESNAVINDQFGTANSVSQTISALTSSYTVISGFFRMPLVMAMTQIKMEIALSTAITNTEVLHMDSLTLVEATPLYQGGPLAIAIRGSTKFAINDKFTLAIANNLTITSFVRSLDRWLNLRALNRRIPSAVSETIPDSLIA